MALELKNKVAKEKDDKNKKGKYKRKRNVFGKRLTRFGIIALIAVEIIAFAAVKVFFTLSQNKRQKNIDNEIKETNAKIQQVNYQLKRPEVTYENIGNLIATLPTSFDQQATSLDLDRMIILSGLSENSAARKITKVDQVPFETNTKTLQAIKIDLELYGEIDDIASVQKFLSYLTDYKHENFYYVEEISYGEDRSLYKRNDTRLTIYTFYNETSLTK